METTVRRIVPYSLKITTVGVFAAITLVLMIVPLPSIGYINLSAVMETIGGTIGSVLLLGALGVVLGSVIWNFVSPNALFLQLGFLPMAAGALSIGLLVQKKWIPVVIFGLIVFALFFLSPGGAEVPLWTVSDKLVSVFLAIPAAILAGKAFGKKLNIKWLIVAIFLISFVGLQIDGMVGNTLFGWYGYSAVGMSASDVAPMFTVGFYVSIIERIVVALVSTGITVPIVIAMDKNPKTRWMIQRNE